MDGMLEKNMCKLPDLVANSDVSDLKERIERYIDPALQYACRSWYTHLVAGRSTSVSRLEIASTTRLTLEKELLFWLEVLSVLGSDRNAVDALQASVDLLEVCSKFAIDISYRFLDLIQEPPTLDLAKDCSRFVFQYFEIVDASSTHNDYSALVMTLKTSMIRKLYVSHVQPFTRVVHGVPSSWDLHAAVATRPFTTGLAVWSSCSRFIAVLWSDSSHGYTECSDSPASKKPRDCTWNERTSQGTHLLP